jgi:hypothetical protein
MRTGQPLKTEEHFPFFFQFKMNSEGTCWVLTGGSGCSTHSNHFNDKSSRFQRIHKGPAMVKQDIANLTGAMANTDITPKIMTYKCGID